jgi:glycosyltransferase involved in cell wall biosynthesis
MISVVVIARNEGARLIRTVERYAATLPVNSEIIVVDDASTDGSAGMLPTDRRIRVVRGSGKGVAQGRNLGARRAKGDLLVFSDAHIDVEKGWWKPLAARATRPGVGGVAPAVASVTRPKRIGHGLRFSGSDLDVVWLWREDMKPHRAPLIPWCSTMMARSVFEASGGFDEGMRGAGSIDNEMSLRLWLLGYELWIEPAVVVGHLFRRTRPYPIIDWFYLHNRARLAFVHLELPRIARFLRVLRHDPGLPPALALAATADIARRRRVLTAQRRYDSEWYFKRFDPRA